jgi:WD40 repeat protein
MIRNNSQCAPPPFLPLAAAGDGEAGQPGRQPVSSEDETHGFQGFLVDRARRKQAAQQPPSTRAHDITRAAHFNGAATDIYWLSAAWSHDGAQVAVGGRNPSGKHGKLEIWNGHTGHLEGHGTRHLRHDLAGPVVSMSWSPDSTRLATIEGDATSSRLVLNIRSQAEGKRPISLPDGPDRSHVAWSPDGSQLALSARAPRSVLLVDAATGQVRRTLEDVSGPVAWEPGGHRIAASDGANVAIIDAATGQRQRTITGQQDPATAVSWATHGKVLAVSDGEHIRVVDADNGERLWNLPWATAEGDRSDDPSVHYLGWLDGGRYLLEFRKHGAWSRSDANTRIGTVTLWDVTTRSLFWFLFHETILHVQRPPAEVLVGPQGGRQTLIFFDHQPPQVWEISGDLPGLQP